MKKHLLTSFIKHDKISWVQRMFLISFRVCRYIHASFFPIFSIFLCSAVTAYFTMFVYIKEYIEQEPKGNRHTLLNKLPYANHRYIYGYIMRMEYKNWHNKTGFKKTQPTFFWIVLFIMSKH